MPSSAVAAMPARKGAGGRPAAPASTGLQDAVVGFIGERTDLRPGNRAGARSCTAAATAARGGTYGRLNTSASTGDQDAIALVNREGTDRPGDRAGARSCTAGSTAAGQASTSATGSVARPPRAAGRACRTGHAFNGSSTFARQGGRGPCDPGSPSATRWQRPARTPTIACGMSGFWQMEVKSWLTAEAGLHGPGRGATGALRQRGSDSADGGCRPPPFADNRVPA
jgi:hypothetical protein